MLYADLDLDVKLSDAVNGLKDSKKNGAGNASGIINAESAAADVKAQVGMAAVVPGVSVAQAAATMGPQYDNNALL
eukprot:CAMPEP_0185599336 /NCGR_PEP_ID=MMETSP0434-20130131/82623_1 /TAXON_ID=626734 ORGANISM="Favella taraikaensis, Strain Fe Narragansett Bay" /NCGR_SAMPLE_ID=MMETSP0434 /ASSEMBLY_ACC=CAM_ASM_000379 /LENGTH=75 /DNA_ID=CAMNT_0028228681 /DNA_START=2038 /DNA_END=2265 /DNA_ORIENTATION=+